MSSASPLPPSSSSLVSTMEEEWRERILERLGIVFKEEEKHATSAKIPTRKSPFHRVLWEWNREHFDPATHQRTDVRFDPDDGRPLPMEQRPVPRVCDCRVSMTGNQYMNGEVPPLRPPPLTAEELETPVVHLTWDVGAVTSHSLAFIRNTLHLVNVENDDVEGNNGTVEPVPWSGWTESDLRSDRTSMTYRDIVKGDDVDDNDDDGNNKNDKENAHRCLSILWKYGILLVTGVPPTEAAVAAVAAAVGGGSVKTNPASLLSPYHRDRNNEVQPEGETNGHWVPPPHGTDGPMRTLYGTVWSTHAGGGGPSSDDKGTSVADSAYGSGALPLHTDMTYLTDPPGLQIFHMVQPAEAGGESIFADGFAAAERLRRDHPKHFRTLSTVERRYRCIDDTTGWHLEARGPVLQTLSRGRLRIRHNDLDRLPLDVFGTYKNDEGDGGDDDNDQDLYTALDDAHEQWDELLRSDNLRLVVSMNAGDMVIVANQRCFHGRKSFRTSNQQPRIVRGCYVSQDELDSRFRRAGLLVE